MTATTVDRGPRRTRIHPAWIAAGVTFLTLVFSSSLRGVITLLILPLHDEFGWSRATVTLGASVNLLMFGLMGPFAAALMGQYGLRRVVMGALLVVVGGIACLGAAVASLRVGRAPVTLGGTAGDRPGVPALA